ncbi:MAG: hypothetical protein A2672_01550 [Candidatus Wildermuthbacteria bacterium RIFCSPHIGHO2_01_FULL_49_22b]|uniref:SDR family oxidoreductase n=1 Tax=Candidatus Wildermuthbacteria bacterium RIFCSPHIGHO2_01_FULL_49_22b TaxID=1802448 RepID=A0A1G2QXY1_9BACT|nr:MAG: hypothetical protein A2672_01550 [Candidatus Wildermuthbacteria bacterium RIFCSPHIGHO2_01_FULL_49_22b]
MYEGEVLDMEGQTIIVLGGAGAVGTAICERLQKEGANVVVADIKDVLNPVDLSQEQEVEKFFGQLKKDHPRIHGLVSSVYGGPNKQYEGLHEVRFEEVLEDIRHTLIAPCRAIKATVEWMRQTGGGRIVVISSINAHLALGELGYDIAKAGLDKFVLEAALSHARDGIYIFDLAPGTIAPTPAWQGAEQQKTLEGIRATIPDHQVTTPHEVAGIVSFLLCDATAVSLIGHPIIADRLWAQNKVRGGFER